MNSCPRLSLRPRLVWLEVLHAVIPALGVPSLLSRVIDVVSVNGQSLLPVIHIYTNDQGVLSWALLGCPCLEASELSSAVDDASTVAHGENTICGFHKALRMVTVVHSLEKQYHIHRDDRAARLVLTIGDQAIQGPGSIGFTKEEFRRDAIQADPLSEAICKFHIADGIGNCVSG